MRSKIRRSVLVTVACALCTPLFLSAQSSQSHSKSVCTDSDVDALRQGSDLLQQSRFDDAVRLLRPVAQSDCDVRAALLLATALEASSQASEATTVLEHAHQLWPSDPSISTSLARIYMTAGQVQQAAHALDRFQPTRSTPPQAIEMAAVVFLTAHNLTRAESIARIGYDTAPSVQSLLLLANAIQLEGRYKDVIALLDARRKTYDASAPFLVTIAQSEYDAAIYDKAQADVERAITIDRSLYAAHYLLGNILLKTGNPEGAVGEYRQAVQLEPSQPRTYYYLALALRAEHNETQEEAELQQAITLDAHYALAQCEMGRVLLSENRLPDAVSHLQLAVADNASSEQAYYLLSRAYDRMGDKSHAQEMAQRLAVVRRQNHRSQGPSSNSADQGHSTSQP